MLLPFVLPSRITAIIDEEEIMIKQSRNMPFQLMVIVLATLLTACDGGPGESEFVDACIKEGENVASKMLDKEMGIKRDSFCKCGAKVARSSLSADAYRVMILGMQSKNQEASAITSKMSESEQQALFKGTAEMFEKCVEGKK